MRVENLVAYSVLVALAVALSGCATQSGFGVSKESTPGRCFENADAVWSEAADKYNSKINKFDRLMATQGVQHTLYAGCAIGGLVVERALDRLNRGQISDRDVAGYVDELTTDMIVSMLAKRPLELIGSTTLMIPSAVPGLGPTPAKMGEMVASYVRPFLPRSASELRADAKAWSGAVEYALARPGDVRRDVTDARSSLSGRR
jgi:hypothetical protein